MGRWGAFAVVLAMVVVAAGCAETTMGLSPSRLLRVESSAGQTPGGRPSVSGYVHNDYGRPAVNVRLLVERLDGSGQVTGRAVIYVAGTVPALGRAYFEAAVPAAESSYRVSILSFEIETGAGS